MLQISGKFTAAGKRTGDGGCLTMKKKLLLLAVVAALARGGIVCFRLFLGRARLPGISGDQLHGGAVRPAFDVYRDNRCDMHGCDGGVQDQMT
jgi:hypothetical protein